MTSANRPHIGTIGFFFTFYILIPIKCKITEKKNVCEQARIYELPTYLTLIFVRALVSAL